MSKIITPTTPVLIQDLGMKYPKDTSKKKFRYGLYKCSCGEEFITQQRSVDKGSTKSCGCHYRYSRGKYLIKHGMSSHRLSMTWYGIMDRVFNYNCSSYHRYGGRGITVCERWLDINNFIEDMYPTFEEGLSIDRIDSDGNYEPSNCRWANDSIQGHNKKLSRIKNGKTSKYRGVHRDAYSFRACVYVENVKINLGSFKSEDDAALEYNKFIIKHKLHDDLNIISASSISN